MSIVSSTFVVDGPQKSGRRWVVETHVDHLGGAYQYRYLADAGLDITATMTARAVQLAGDLTNAEIAANIAQVFTFGSLAFIALNHSTAAQSRTALREAYKSATKVEAIMLGDFLSALTDAQLQALFGLTAAQVTTLRTNKLTPAASAAVTIRAATGQ